MDRSASKTQMVTSPKPVRFKGDTWFFRAMRGHIITQMVTSPKPLRFENRG